MENVNKNNTLTVGWLAGVLQEGRVGLDAPVAIRTAREGSLLGVLAAEVHDIDGQKVLTIVQAGAHAPVSKSQDLEAQEVFGGSATPITCKQAAEKFREWADRAAYESERHRCVARAEIIEAFGDTPVPEAILKVWDFER